MKSSCKVKGRQKRPVLIIKQAVIARSEATERRGNLIMSKAPNFDKKIEPILAALHPGQAIKCPITDQDWFLDEKEIEICHRFKVPPCRIEPMTRMNYLNGFSNGLAIFWKPQALTGKPILSAIHPDLPFRIVSGKEYQTVENLDFGFNYAADQTVFNQVWQLLTTTLFNATRNADVDDWSLVTGSAKTRNSFICSGGIYKNCFYAVSSIFSENSINLNSVEGASGSFSVGGSQKIANSAFVFESRSCFSSAFLFDCIECEHCFGAVNKRHKKFIWFNEQLSESEYNARIKQIDLSDRRQVKKGWNKFINLISEKGVWPSEHGLGNTESNGERLFNCVRCKECFFEHASTDCYRCRIGIELQNSCYASGSAYANNYYLVTGGTFGANCKMTSACYSSINLEYCLECTNCEYCFGCVNLVNKKFCVFNKQYQKEEYWSLVDQIKCDMLEHGEYGQFFPAKMSVPGFQHSIGNFFLHYSHEDCRRFGALTVNLAHGQIYAPAIDMTKVRQADEIPEKLEDCESFVDIPIYDKALGRYFSVLPAEYEIYKDKHWPFPTEHYATRLTHLLDFTYGPIPEDKICASCSQTTTTYNNQAFPNRRIYCHDCYFKYLEENN